jgi:hypothetical protein
MANKLFENYPSVDYNLSGDGREIQTIRNIMLRAKIRDSIKKSVATYFDYEMKEMQTPQEIAHKFYGDSDLFWIIFMMNDIVDPYYDLPLSSRSLEKYIDKKYPGQYYSVQSYSGNILVSSTLTGNISGAVGEVLEWDPTNLKIVVKMREGKFTLNEQLDSVKVHNGTDITGQVLLGGITKLNKFGVHHYENLETGEVLSKADYNQLPVAEKREVDNYTFEQETNNDKAIIKLLRPEHVQKVVQEIETILRRS